MTKKLILKDPTKQKPTAKLKAYQRDLYDIEKRLIICAGLPSTGKTRCAVESGVEQVLGYKYEKLIIIRPVIIPSYGLLPGSSGDKMYPYIHQAEIYVDKCSQQSFGAMLMDGRIEIWPSDLLQGNRFQNSFIIYDEVQNEPKDKTFQILSRVGEGCKWVVIGDISRGQENKKIKTNSLLHYCIDKFKDKDYATVHTFYEESDILGDTFTKHIILDLMEDFV